MELAEIETNPVCQRIFQYFLLHDTGTVESVYQLNKDLIY